MEDDWDLQAVVRGYCTNSNSSSSSNCSNSSRSCSTITTMNTTSLATSMENPFSLFAPVDLQQQQQEQRQNGNLTNFASLPDLFEQRTGTVEEELEQLYKPFFTKFEPSTTTISLHLHSSVNDPVTSCASIPPPLPVQQKQQQKQQIQSHRSSNLAVSGSASNASTTRPKRRKNQQKRVVCQVPAEGLSSDMWAWRKYGQKPIKGSPYPRGYYRCSSSKGCLARKQVERSRSDPGMFVITYTAEHNHPVPTHRNSLAGSTRNKISTTTTSSTTTTQRLTTGDSDPATTTTTNSSSRPDCSPSSPASTNGLSPTTPLASSMDDELVQQSKPQESEEEEEAEAGGMELDEDDDGDGEVLIPEGLLTDDLFNGLEELAGPTIGAATSPTLDDCFADHFPTGFPASWFNNSHNAAAAAGGS